MLRLRFTAEDLMNVRFAARPAPLLELGMAVATYQRDDAVFARWTRRARLTGEARALLELIPPGANGPLFLDPYSDGLEDGLETVLSTPPDHVRAELVRTTRPTPWTTRLAGRDREAWRTLERALRGAYATLIAPDRERVRASFDADLAWRRALLAERGVAAALASLYPGSRWDGTTLEVEVPEESAHAPAGRGLTLMPSAFWTGRPMIGRHSDGSMLLLYPALTPLPLVDVRARDALAALLGRTRAAILSLVTEGRTTSELAAELGVSAASVSAHTKTLRGAGLIVTLRTGKAVNHVATPLGMRLLRES
ncbi:ArsR/SmtB family transcription factor [Actinoallomurus iriomotensis]|uniref:Regulatory protein n=1 Tax=Actinoallomurus iriomotensis TaxID=478107 RepID=A0A9W6VNU7_9ACTN|nr:helix-turn-helix domain-containing protein [Actinoallomurus iriomotensis]GLY74139.1 putative regulatory protein [Actinoallomurus iriomotensis]